MALIAALVLASDISHERFGEFGFGLERGNQRIFGFNEFVGGPAREFQSDSKVHLDLLEVGYGGEGSMEDGSGESGMGNEV